MQSIASTQKASANSRMATDCCESLNPESKSKSGVDHGPGQDLGQRPGLDRVRDQPKARVAWTKGQSDPGPRAWAHKCFSETSKTLRELVSRE